MGFGLGTSGPEIIGVECHDDSTMANPNRRESPNPIGRPLTTNARDFPKAGRDPNR